MGAEAWLARLAGRPYLIISREERERLVQDCESVKELRPPLAGPLLRLDCGSHVFVVESSDKAELILRNFDSAGAAEAFIKDRLDTYDRMWDGCGCKVNYYE